MIGVDRAHQVTPGVNVIRVGIHSCANPCPRYFTYRWFDISERFVDKFE